MSLLSPKPIIAHLVQSWRIQPGLTFALVEDIERRVWIVQSCPVGTHFWTVAQAAVLPQGARTRRVLQEAVRVGRLREVQIRQRQVVARPGDSPLTLADDLTTFTPLKHQWEPDSFYREGQPERTARRLTLSHAPVGV